MKYSNIIFFCLFQVDNPVSVLTQEMSKQFLQSKNEGDKYKVRSTKVNINLTKEYINRLSIYTEHYSCSHNKCYFFKPLFKVVL